MLDIPSNLIPQRTYTTSHLLLSVKTEALPQSENLSSMQNQFYSCLHSLRILQEKHRSH